MTKLYCLRCREESDTRLDLQCPHCGSRGKWAEPVPIDYAFLGPVDAQEAKILSESVNEKLKKYEEK